MLTGTNSVLALLLVLWKVAAAVVSSFSFLTLIMCCLVLSLALGLWVCAGVGLLTLSNYCNRRLVLLTAAAAACGGAAFVAALLFLGHNAF